MRVKGKLTNCETGDRLVKCKVLKKPIPRNLQIGKYLGKMFHSGQPEFQNRNPDERAKTCHKCLKPGHLIYECPNDWVSRKCEQSGHKMIDCPQDFHYNEADDPVHNGDKSTEIQPLVEHSEATLKAKPEKLPVSKTSNGNNKQHANRSGPQKTVKMTHSDNNNTDKSQSSIDRYIRTPQRRLAANVRTPPTPDLHDKTGGTKKNQNHSKINCFENLNMFYTRCVNIL